MDVPTPMTIEGLAAALGGPAPAPAEPPTPADPPAPEPTPSDPPPAQDPPTPASDPTPSDPPPVAPEQPDPIPPANDPNMLFNQQKANEAFANLRVRNKQLEETLKGVAALVGIDGNVENETLVPALQAKILENQAKQQNVPVELLQRLQTQEQQLAQFTAQQRQRNIEASFAKIRETYKLDQSQMNKFAEDLIANGLNPFTQEVDLEAAYRNLHFDDIVKVKVQEAVLAEQARAAAAAANGSNPGNQQGNPGQGEIGKVNSVRDLDSWFAQMQAK